MTRILTDCCRDTPGSLRYPRRDFFDFSRYFAFENTEDAEVRLWNYQTLPPLATLLVKDWSKESKIWNDRHKGKIEDLMRFQVLLATRYTGETSRFVVSDAVYEVRRMVGEVIVGNHHLVRDYGYHLVLESPPLYDECGSDQHGALDLYSCEDCKNTKDRKGCSYKMNIERLTEFVKAATKFQKLLNTEGYLDFEKNYASALDRVTYSLAGASDPESVIGGMQGMAFIGRI